MGHPEFRCSFLIRQQRLTTAPVLQSTTGLIQEKRSSMYLVLFIFFGGLCVAGALNLLLQRHPINSALSLIVVMSSLAVLYLLLGAEFLAAAQVIVYSGAIMVLFTFVIMLLNAGKEERTHGSNAAYIVGIPGVAILVSLLAFIFLSARSHLAQARLGDYVVSTCCCPSK
jgi:NADH-quinone oxidoreductase subunit J